LTSGGVFTVLEAEDSTTLIRSAKHEHPDVIITDNTMPGVPGLSAAIEIRRFFRGPLLMISSHVDGSLQEIADEINMQVISKKDWHFDQKLKEWLTDNA
jgi:DNA-binding NarL/FixJ family response regulator